MSTLVIGVGGGGRGVLNWLKRTLEHEHGSVEKAGFRLLLIDGPDVDQYRLPDESQIDVSAGSPNFYQLTKQPRPAIQAIASGRSFAYVDRWLMPSEARRIPVESLIPEKGYGQNRVAGRVGFFLEASDLRTRLQRAVGDATLAFVVGSQSGGTGAGLLLDVAHLLRSVKPANCQQVGIIFLPNAYQKVFSDPTEAEKRDARGFAAIRELIRDMGALGTPAVRMDYADGVSVANEKVFDLCFTLDGGSGDFGLRGIYPVNGICAAACDAVLAIAQSDSIRSGDIANWIGTYTDPQPGHQRFGFFGIHSLVYSAQEVIRTFALKFTLAVYQEMLTLRTPEERAEGPNLANTVLEQVVFGQMPVTLAKGFPVPLDPPLPNDPGRRAQFLQFRQNFTVGDQAIDLSFPFQPMLELPAVVDRTRLFHGVDNDQVPPQCQTWTDNYCGKETDTKPNDTVWGWVNYESARIQERFKEHLLIAVKGLFYDLQTNKPLALDLKPNSIMIACEFLRSLRDKLEGFNQALAQTYKHWVSEQKVIEQQRQEVEARFQELQAARPRDRGAQDAYTYEHQELLELLVWQILVRGAQQLVAALLEMVNSLWKMVGDPAEGWIDYLEKSCQAAAQRELDELLKERTICAQEVTVRTYFPSPNGLAELQMYRDFVHNKEYVKNLLGQMSWEFYSERPQALGFVAPKEEVANYRLLLRFPPVVNFDKDAYTASLVSVVTGEFRRLVLSTHTWQEVAQFVTNLIDAPLKAIKIWDALHYDFLHEWSQGRDADIRAYVQQRVTELLHRSVPLMETQAAGVGTSELVEEGDCLSDFLPTENPQPNSMQDLAKQIHDELKNRLGATAGQKLLDDSDFGHSLTHVRFWFKLFIENWAYYRTCFSNYWKQVNKPLTDKDNLPVHCATEELNAAMQVESYLATHQRLRPPRCLDVSVVRHLGNWKDFQLFALAFVCDLLPTRDDPDPALPRHYWITATTAGSRTADFDLGSVCNLDGVLNVFLAPDRANVREAVRQEWNQYVAGFRGKSDWPQCLISDLEARITNITLPPEHNSDPEMLHREDLKLAMWAAVLRYADDIATT